MLAKFRGSEIKISIVLTFATKFAQYDVVKHQISMSFFRTVVGIGFRIWLIFIMPFFLWQL